MAHQPKQIPFIENNKLPNLFIDQARMRKRSDGISYIQLFSLASESWLEQTRFTCTKEFLIRLIDLLTTQTGYFPSPPDKVGPSPKKVTTKKARKRKERKA